MRRRGLPGNGCRKYSIDDFEQAGNLSHKFRDFLITNNDKDGEEYG
jgi:hypothetical protein